MIFFIMHTLYEQEEPNFIRDKKKVDRKNFVPPTADKKLINCGFDPL